MQGDRPLLIKLTANLTPFGTMIYIPTYWSLDPKRDLNWRAITALHKARGVRKQGSKLGANQAAARSEAIRASKLCNETDALKLKGEKRISWMIEKLGGLAHGRAAVAQDSCEGTRWNLNWMAR